ncbi:porin [Burkholderia cepacia]|uniref:porin n=1 Tax=Burkholderia cepacia TaxID=292 RepID=UPI002AB633C5|nr:porin [Burkholderia cepacia]
MFKKPLLAVILLPIAFVSSISHAQSSVQLYGNLDVGMTYVNDVGGKRSIGLADGIQRSNVFGIQGTEDLGDGTAAIFKLNTGFSIDSGALKTSNLIFKEAWAGLKDDKLGRAMVGRQYDFIKEITNSYMACLECGVYVVPNADIDRTNGDFVTNSVQYRTPNYAGLSMGAMYGFGSTDSTATNAGRMYSLFAQYAHGPFSAILVTTNINKISLSAGNIGIRQLFGTNVTSSTTFVTNRRILAGGVSYKIGDFTGMAYYTNTRLTYQQNSAIDQEWSLGGTYWLSGNVILAVSEGLNTLEGSSWYTTNAGLSYYLSKTTRTYLDLAYQHAAGNNAYAAMRNAGIAASANQTLVRIGMIKYF